MTSQGLISARNAGISIHRPSKIKQFEMATIEIWLLTYRSMFHAAI
jgi:hypothetical protein